MKLLIVDDHAILREGLAVLLRQNMPELIVTLAGSGIEALQLAQQHPDLDIVVMDLDLRTPGMNGLETIRELARERPDLPVVVLSSMTEPEMRQEALAAGAVAFVPKSPGPELLIATIGTVLGRHGSPEPVSDTTIRALLTTQQMEVMRLLADGSSVTNKEIASRLGIALGTVKAHITPVLKALNVTSRNDVRAAARKAGLI